MLTLRKLTAFLFLLLLLSAPWQASAVSRAARHRPPNVDALPFDLMSRAWESLARLWAKNGCVIDPNGRCSPMPAPVIHGKNGCRIDPDGRCSSAPVPLNQFDNGCGIDPSGHCHP